MEFEINSFITEGFENSKFKNYWAERSYLRSSIVNFYIEGDGYAQDSDNARRRLPISQ